MNPKLIRTGIAELLPMVRTGDPAKHVSAIIRSLCLRLGHFEDTGPIVDHTRVEMGCTFEDAMAVALARRYAASSPDRYLTPGELELDGLIGTPDLLDIVDDRVIEIKLTWTSSRHDAESPHFWRYWTQIKAYTSMIGWRAAELHVCHINGDYKQDRGPVYNVWLDEFTERELDENFRMLKSHSELMSREQKAGT